MTLESCDYGLGDLVNEQLESSATLIPHLLGFWVEPKTGDTDSALELDLWVEAKIGDTDPALELGFWVEPKPGDTDSALELDF